MPTELENMMEEVKTDLKSNYSDFKGIYLFGSRARGDAHEDSDYDVAAIFNRDISNKFSDEIILRMFKFEVKYDFYLDSHVFSYDSMNNPKTPFGLNLKNEGKLL